MKRHRITVQHKTLDVEVNMQMKSIVVYDTSACYEGTLTQYDKNCDLAPRQVLINYHGQLACGIHKILICQELTRLKIASVYKAYDVRLIYTIHSQEEFIQSRGRSVRYGSEIHRCVLNNLSQEPHATDSLRSPECKTHSSVRENTYQEPKQQQEVIDFYKVQLLYELSKLIKSHATVVFSPAGTVTISEGVSGTKIFDFAKAKELLSFSTEQ